MVVKKLRFDMCIRGAFGKQINFRWAWINSFPRKLATKN